MPCANVNRHICKKLALDLFSGTGSVGRALSNLGFDVISLDINPKFSPDIVCDILNWDFKNTRYRPGDFWVIAAGVPCTEYSQAKTTGERNLAHADSLVAKTLEIINWFNPKLWLIENPRGGLLKDREIVRDLNYIDVDYCQFCDWGYQKPTRIWCCPEISKLPSVLCDSLTCRHVQSNPGGHFEKLGGASMRLGREDKYRTPASLVEYLVGGSHGSRGFVPVVQTRVPSPGSDIGLGPEIYGSLWHEGVASGPRVDLAPRVNGGRLLFRDGQTHPQNPNVPAWVGAGGGVPNPGKKRCLHG